MKCLKIIKKNLLSIYIILNIIMIFIDSYKVTTYKIPYIYYANHLIVAMIINVVIIGIYLIIKAIKKQKYRIKIYDWLILIILFLSAISMIFAINRYAALVGSYERYEGIYSIMYYFSILFLSSLVNKKSKKVIIVTILLTGIFQSIYGFLQINNAPFVQIVYKIPEIMASGLTLNPNFFGTYMLICLCYSIGLLIEGKTIVRQIINVILISVFMIGLLISNATSCAVALLAILLYVIIYCIKNRYIEKLICLIILLTFITAVVNNEKKTTLVNDVIKTKNETVEIAKGNVNDYYGTRRIKIWKETLKIVPKYWLHGSGIDNYIYSFGSQPLRISRRLYDKAHNEYLQILVTEGVFSLIAYITLYIIIIIYGIEYTYKKKKIYLLLPVMGYMIQAFFNISVIEVAPIFYIAIGLLIDRDYKFNHLAYKKYIKNFSSIIIALLSLIILLPLLAVIALLIKLIDNENPLYTQIRTGKNGKEFKIYKFRTMKNHRVTKIGRILRNTSLDELPQLINIIKGEMSIVGPRPWIIDYYNKFNDEQKQRVSVKPGVIGLAQVNGRNSIGIIKKIEYDLEYVNNISLLTDIKIFLRSFKVIFVNEDETAIENNIKKELRELSKYNKKLNQKEQKIKKAP